MSKTFDLIGQKFGKLTVIEKIPSNPMSKKKYIRWKCLCECGNEKIASTAELRSGIYTQCATCGKKSSSLKRRVDYCGKKYGKLTVKKMLYNYNNTKHTYCLCDCECGTKDVLINVSNLLKPAMHSCGCAKRSILIRHHGKNIDGNKYGRLTVLETYWEEKPPKVKCKCDCGNIVILNKNYVQSGHTQSCGCLHSEKTSEKNTKDWSNIISPYGIKFIKQHSMNAHGQWLWECQCFCGNKFIALPAKINNGHITSCGCRNASSGEELITNILTQNKIDFKREYTFSNCKYKNKLRYDFALFRNGEVFYLIEFNGIQHYKPIDYFGGEEGFHSTQLRDKIKTDFANDNNIPLLKLPYTLSADQIKEKIIDIINP